jgi:hypothetical protein
VVSLRRLVREDFVMMTSFHELEANMILGHTSLAATASEINQLLLVSTVWINLS